MNRASLPAALVRRGRPQPDPVLNPTSLPAVVARTRIAWQ